MEIYIDHRDTPRAVNSSHDDILKRITYKDGIQFHWQSDAWDQKRLVIEVSTIDSYNPPTPIIIEHTFFCPWTKAFLSIDWSDEAKIDWVFDCLMKAERHEAREFFKVDGKVFDPPGHGMDDPYR